MRNYIALIFALFMLSILTTACGSLSASTWCESDWITQENIIAVRNAARERDAAIRDARKARLTPDEYEAVVNNAAETYRAIAEYEGARLQVAFKADSVMGCTVGAKS